MCTARDNRRRRARNRRRMNLWWIRVQFPRIIERHLRGRIEAEFPRPSPLLERIKAHTRT